MEWRTGYLTELTKECLMVWTTGYLMVWTKGYLTGLRRECSTAVQRELLPRGLHHPG